jgi:hypothetical protein
MHWAAAASHCGAVTGVPRLDRLIASLHAWRHRSRSWAAPEPMRWTRRRERPQQSEVDACENPFVKFRANAEMSGHCRPDDYVSGRTAQEKPPRIATHACRRRREGSSNGLADIRTVMLVDLLERAHASDRLGTPRQHRWSAPQLCGLRNYNRLLASGRGFQPITGVRHLRSNRSAGSVAWRDGRQSIAAHHCDSSADDTSQNHKPPLCRHNSKRSVESRSDSNPVE